MTTMLAMGSIKAEKNKQMGYRAHPRMMSLFKARVAELAEMLGGKDATEPLSESKTVEMFMAYLCELPLMEAVRHVKALKASHRALADRIEDEAIAAREGRGRQPEGPLPPAGGVVLEPPLKPKESAQSSSSKPPGQGKPRGQR